MKMELSSKTQCPDTNTLAEFVEGKLLGKQQKEVFMHIANCSICQDLCRYAAKMANTKQRPVSQRVQKNIQDRIEEAKQNYLRSSADIKLSWEQLVKHLTATFRRLEDSEVIAAGLECQIINFSASTELEDRHWRMQLSIPNQLTEQLQIQMQAPGIKKLNGTLIFCGNELNVINGESSISYKKLQGSFANPEIAFIFEDGKRIPGYPELFTI